MKGIPDCWIAISALLIYEVRAQGREGPNTLASVRVCVLKPKTRGGRDPVTQAGGSGEARPERAAETVEAAQTPCLVEAD